MLQSGRLLSFVGLGLQTELGTSCMMWHEHTHTRAHTQHGMPPPMPPGFGADHSKGGVAPHLNPAFLQDMQSHGGNMVSAAARSVTSSTIMTLSPRDGFTPLKVVYSHVCCRNNSGQCF